MKRLFLAITFGVAGLTSSINANTIYSDLDRGYMTAFFRQVKIGVLTLTSRKSNEKIKIYGPADFKGFQRQQAG